MITKLRRLFEDIRIIKRALFCMLDNQSAIMLYLQYDCMSSLNSRLSDYARTFDIRLKDTGCIKTDYRKLLRERGESE